MGFAIKVKKAIKAKKHLLVALGMVLVMVPVFTACDVGKKTDVVARVGKETITKDELYDVLVKQNGEAALESLINKKIIELESAKEKTSVTKEEVQGELDKTIEQYGGKEQFDQALLYYGVTEDGIRDNIKTSLSLQKLLDSRITITEEEMQNYFTENKASFDAKEQVRASHILVDSKEKALDVKAKLAEGVAFADLAKEYNTDATKDKGGDLGFFAKGEMVKEFEDVAFSMQPGEISAPVETEFGYHIIKVEEKKEATEATFEDAKEQVKNTLFQQKMPSAAEAWFKEKGTEYKVKNSLLDKK